MIILYILLYILLYELDIKAIADNIGTRNIFQVRSKIQKEEMKKSKLNKENKENKEKNEDIYVEFTDKNIL